MILEERDYRIRPGRTAEFIETYKKPGLAIQKEILGGFVGHFVCDIGELNHVVAFWRYRI
nr:NIPSNAP family protein [Mesorhizobium sp.]